MKIEINKTYKMRSGSVVKIIKRDRRRPYPYEGLEGTKTWWFSETGSCATIISGKQHPIYNGDLILEDND